MKCRSIDLKYGAIGLNYRALDLKYRAIDLKFFSNRFEIQVDAIYLIRTLVYQIQVWNLHPYPFQGSRKIYTQT